MYCRCSPALLASKFPNGLHIGAQTISITLHYTALLLGTYNPGPSELCPFSPHEYTALAALE